MSNKEYRRKLNEMIDEMFSAASDQGILPSAWAERAGVHVKTIYRIASGVTVLPYLRTVMRMAEAVGLSFGIINRRVRRKTA